MADQKITALDALTTAESTDILPIVDDPSGAPVTKKITVGNIVSSLKASGAEIDTGTDDAKIVTPKAIADSKVVFTEKEQTLTSKTLTSPTINTPIISTPTIRLWDGWNDANETWIYASASTITVPAGATSKYQKGDKIRLKQGGDWKYFYIIEVADTLLTVTGGSDYTVASAAITDNYYSKAENPQGFPDWFNFTPSWAASGSMTYTSVTTSLCKFRISGKTLTLQVKASGTTGGTASNGIYLTQPIANLINVSGVNFGCATIKDGPYFVGHVVRASSYLEILKPDISNFGLGVAREIRFTAIYEI